MGTRPRANKGISSHVRRAKPRRFLPALAVSSSETHPRQRDSQVSGPREHAGAAIASHDLRLTVLAPLFNQEKPVEVSSAIEEQQALIDEIVVVHNTPSDQTPLDSGGASNERTQP